MTELEQCIANTKCTPDHYLTHDHVVRAIWIRALEAVMKDAMSITVNGVAGVGVVPVSTVRRLLEEAEGLSE